MKLPSILWAIICISFSNLLFELSLIRILAATMWYYWGVLIIALALLGISVSALCCFLWDNLTGPKHKIYFAKSAIAFALLSPLSIFVHLEVNFLNHSYYSYQFYSLLVFQVFLFFCVFFSSGLCISIVLFRYRNHINKVYFCDLSGAALGSLLFLPLLYQFSPLAISFFVSSIAILSGHFILKGEDHHHLRRCFKLGFITSLILFFSNDYLGILQVSSIKTYHEGFIQRREKDKVFEKWSPISRIVVYPPERKNRKYFMKGERDSYEYMKIETNGGASTKLYRAEGGISLENLKMHSGNFHLVHTLKHDAEVLVIGVGGGIDVIMGLIFNQKSITAVEIDPIMIELVTKRFADYIGRIFDSPRVTLHNKEGRNFVASSKDKYDIITISMSDSWSGAMARGYLFNENSLYTKEAIHDYVLHLKEDGILSITRYYSWDETLRLTNTILEYLEKKGIKDAHNRIVVVSNSTDDPLYKRFGTILLKNGDFSSQETESIREHVKRIDGKIIYAPNTSPEELDQSNYARLFQALISNNLPSRSDIVKSYSRNISPSSDDKPFFFFMHRWYNLFQFNKLGHPSRHMAISILNAIFIIITVFSVMMIFLPLYFSSKTNIVNAPYRIRSLFYFAFIAIGYMLIEVSLIQRLTIFLGHSTYSFVTVLTGLLFSSGLGSLIGGRCIPSGETNKLIKILGIVVILGLFCGIIIYDQFVNWMWISTIYRIFIAILTVGVLGFFMGMCFPLGILIVQKFHKRLVPWGWGVNGIFSVFATIFALILALNLGFKVTLLCGVISYTGALLIMFNLKKYRLLN